MDQRGKATLYTNYTYLLKKIINFLNIWNGRCLAPITFFVFVDNDMKFGGSV